MTVWLRKDFYLNATSMDKIIIEIALTENHRFLSFVHIYTTKNTKHDVTRVIFESLLIYCLA